MRIINKMIIMEFLPNFIIAQLLLIFVLILNRVFELVNLIIGKNVPIVIVFNLFINTLAFLIFLTIPMAVLVASIMTFGRMSNDFEITALLSCGIDVGILIRNIFIFSIILFTIAFIFSDFIVPDANHRVKKILTEISRMRPTTIIEKGIVKEAYKERTKFYFEDIDKEGHFYNGRIFENKNTFISAINGDIKTQGNKSIVIMNNGRIVENKNNRINIINFEKIKLPIKISEDIKSVNESSRGDREMTIKMLLKKIKHIKENYNEKTSKATIYRYLVEIHKKFSISFGVFGFVLLGSIIGIALKKSGMGIGFSISTLLFVIYYIFIVVGEQLSDKGIIHPIITMWFPNIITLIISIFLIYSILYRMPFRFIEKIIEKLSGKKQ